MIATFTPFQAYRAAEDAWDTELRRAFGSGARIARFTNAACGAPGSKLRQTHDARNVAFDAWQEAREIARRQGIKP